MRPSEARALGRLAGQMVGGVAGWAEQMNRRVATRVFASLGGIGEPVQAAHAAISGRAYATVRLLGAAAGHTAGAAAAPLVGGAALDGSAAGGQLVAMLNALLGDRLHSQSSPLALPMTLRNSGDDVRLDPAGVAAAFPEPTGRLVLFVHGLAETELGWLGRDESGRPWSYAHVLAANGWTGAAVRYNTGRHIAASGASLAQLLEEVVAAWPVPVTDIALIGHSMGGLVIRAACTPANGADRTWLGLLGSCVYLGSPHHGATLEQGVNGLGALLGSIAEAGPLASLLRLRSAGIQDLRYGLITAGDDGDASGPTADGDRPVPLLPTARHHMVAARIGSSDHNPAGMILGDLMVRPGSALGLGDRQTDALNPADRTTLADSNHFGLLKDPRVAEALLRWLP